MSAKRFRIAFSFAGEKRNYVAQVAAILAKRFGEAAILYDKFHEAEFARYDLGIYLPKLYRDESDLIVAVICQNYDEKLWTGWEWMALYSQLSKREGRNIMLSRFEYAHADGLFDAAAFVELDQKTPEQTATLILERLAVNEGKPKDHYTAGTAGSSEQSSTMEYEHAIFLSYAHGEMWSRYVKDLFGPKLAGYLQLEVGGVVELSVDYQIAPGALWGPNLCRRVARSQIMVPLLSADYFHRDWCRREMALMFEREKYLGMEGRDENFGLLIPVRIGDGSTFPDLVGRMQFQDFKEFADPDLPSNSQRMSDFNAAVRKLAKTIADTLPRVPPCRAEWSTFTGDEYFDQLRAKALSVPQPSRIVV